MHKNARTYMQVCADNHACVPAFMDTFTHSSRRTHIVRFGAFKGEEW